MFKFQVNNLIDFGYSLKVLIDKKKYVSSDHQFEIPALKESIDWMEKQISVVTFRQIKDSVRKYMLQEMIVKYAMYHPEYDEKAYISHLKGLDEHAFMEEYTEYVISIKGGLADDDKIKESIQTINGNNLQKEAPSFTAYSYIKRNAKTVKEDFIDLLEEYLPIYLEAKKRVLPVIGESQDIYEGKIHSFEEFLEIMPLAVVDAFPKHNKCICYVTGFMYTAIYLHLEEDTHTMFMAIGAALTWMLTDDYKEAQELAFYKCFSDPTKLKMLKYIKDQHMCADDLAKEMDLSKSNISHHISQLLTAQLIQLSAKDGKKMYYGINTSQMEHMFNKTLDQFRD